MFGASHRRAAAETFAVRAITVGASGSGAVVVRVGVLSVISVRIHRLQHLDALAAALDRGDRGGHRGVRSARCRKRRLHSRVHEVLRRLPACFVVAGRHLELRGCCLGDLSAGEGRVECLKAQAHCRHGALRAPASGLFTATTLRGGTALSGDVQCRVAHTAHGLHHRQRRHDGLVRRRLDRVAAEFAFAPSCLGRLCSFVGELCGHLGIARRFLGGLPRLLDQRAVAVLIAFCAPCLALLPRGGLCLSRILLCVLLALRPRSAILRTLAVCFALSRRSLLVTLVIAFPVLVH
mmetsp:Transcript_98002/g.281917  ORF Transcript_98002/g.281917 Transcript_98002/m.281917 type:complete len:293 (-) Transcript_98002:1486-2364(-)